MINTKDATASIHFLAFISGFLLLIAGCSKKAPEPAQPQPGAELQGTWVGSEVDGRSGSWTFVISENRMDANGPDKEWYKGTLSLDNKTTPMQVNFAITDCSVPDFVGKTALGIYKLEGNTLTLTAGVPGEANRPVSFEAGADVRVWVMTKQ